MKETNEYKPINTFSRSPSSAQIGSYVVVLIETVIFYVMVRSSIQSSTAKLVFTILYSISVALVFISTFICSYTDPSDSAMIQFKSGNRQKIRKQLDSLLYCEYCQSYVTETARHCRQCNRCVETFDHHCMWINNCVGSKNYRSFIVMILSTFFNMSVFIAAVAYLSSEREWKNFIGFMATSWVVLGIVSILALLLLNLIILHLYLACKGYTTYQFIMARREQERQEQMERINEKNRQREEDLKKKYFNNSKRGVASIDQTNIVNPIESKTQQQKEKSSTINYQSVKKNREREELSPASNHKGDSKILREEETMEKIKISQNYPKDQGHTDPPNNHNKSGFIVKEFDDNKNSVIFNNDDEQVEKSETYSIGHYADPFHNKSGVVGSAGSDGSLAGRKGEKTGKDGDINRKSRVGSEREEEDHSQEEDSIKISQFFTRNKSLSFLISSQKAYKPQKKMGNISMHVSVQPQGYSKTRNANSFQQEEMRKNLNSDIRHERKKPLPMHRQDSQESSHKESHHHLPKLNDHKIYAKDKNNKKK